MPALILCTSDDCPLTNIFIDVSERNDLILEISIPGFSKLASLCSNPMCHILSKAFEFSTAITLEIILLSIVSKILFSKIFRISPVDLEERKPCTLSISLLLLICLKKILIYDNIKRFADGTKETDGSIS